MQVIFSEYHYTLQGCFEELSIDKWRVHCAMSYIVTYTMCIYTLLSLTTIAYEANSKLYTC